VTSDEIVTETGKEKMLEMFREAVKGETRENKVFLAAASTKSALSDPQVLQIVHDTGSIITDGDTMTWLLAETAIKEALTAEGWRPADSLIVVVGAKGRLGRSAVDLFERLGFNVIPLTRGDDLDLTGRSYDRLGIVVCTHAFSGEVLGLSTDGDVTIFDAAEPKGGGHLFSKLKSARSHTGTRAGKVRWIGVGYAYHSRLGMPGYQILQLPRKVLFGCFAEALSWGKWIRNGGEIINRVVETGSGHDSIVKEMLEKDGWKPHTYIIASLNQP
jgi:hypothetical protein